MFSLSVRKRLFLSHISIALCISGSIGSFFYINAIESLVTGIKERLQSSAALISQIFDADDLRAIRSEADTTQPAYQETLKKIRNLCRMNPDIAFIYILRREGERIYFVTDSDESAKQAHPGKDYPIGNLSAAAIAGFSRITVNDKIYEDEWGSFLTGYAPIKNGQGEYLIALDMRSATVGKKQKKLREAAMISLVISLLMACLFSHLLSQKFLHQLNLVVKRCTSIAEGRLDSRLGAENNADEFARLMQAFNEMSVALLLSKQRQQSAYEAVCRSREDLEMRIMQRTADLKEINDKLSHEIAQRIVAQKALQEAATTDSLTHLLNRRAFAERLEYEDKRHQRNKKTFTLLLADLDHFKQVNDSLGHAAGDTVLLETAVRMKSMLRAQDSVARWGGEEFIFLLPGTNQEQGCLVAEKIRKRIADSPFFINGEEISVTISIGVAAYKPEQGMDAVFGAVDTALYKAKAQGRNRVVAA